MPSKVNIYTRTGDSGKTSLYGGQRLFKNNLRVHTYGSIDELNSLLGIVIVKLHDKRLEKFINVIQKDLFIVGSSLAGFPDNINELEKRVTEMERIIDDLDNKLPELSNFILPEGVEGATFLYFARAVCRRVEREIVGLSLKEKVDSRIIIYLNRLSDLFFNMARYLNFKAGVTESIWKKNKK